MVVIPDISTTRVRKEEGATVDGIPLTTVDMVPQIDLLDEGKVLIGTVAKQTNELIEETDLSNEVWIITATTDVTEVWRGWKIERDTSIVALTGGIGPWSIV